jgi:hypothetical protein
MAEVLWVGVALVVGSLVGTVVDGSDGQPATKLASSMAAMA